MQTLSPGLTSTEVAARVQRGEVNTLPPRSGRSVADIVRANVFTRINAILMVLFVIVLSTGSITNALFGFLIIANSGIGIFQEVRAKRTLDNLAVLGEGKPIVRREGVAQAMVRDAIVLDDIIEIGPGDQIAVDGEVIEAAYLEVDESLLTGESDPMPKDVGATVMSGSFVVAGSGAYRATKVGAAAYAAQLAAEASKFTMVKSELQQGINKILKLITYLMIPVGILTIWVQLTQVKGDWREAILRTAGALVPMVPEGLVLLTSLAFAVGIIRLGQRQCLVQEMPALEGLARVDVVCADKTGTLTENGMALAETLPLGDTGASYNELLSQLVASDPRPNGSMLAIQAAAPQVSTPWSVAALAPFTSAKKWSGVSFADHGNIILGAPDVLAAPGSAAGVQAQEIASTGRRVLLLGQSDLRVDDPQAPGTLTPLALLVLDQKIRPDARETLEYFGDQDVAVKVISGDNAAAVGAVTRSLGVTSGDAVDARTLKKDDDTAFADEIENNQVFGRVTPHQKRQMVKALQSRGHTVAMTGDGVNDVLALKDADLGVAMGSGSPATRAVAQIVLLDDKFATLPYVVKEGRQVIGNIERVANMFLTKTVYSILLALLVGLWQMPFPFQPIHISLIGWFTIGIPSSIMALAPNTERVRPGFVDRVMRFGLPAGVVVAATTFVSYLLVFPGATASDVLLKQASTAALATMILGGAWVMIVIARPYQWWKIILLVLCLGAAVVAYLLPIGQWFFQLDPSNATLMATGLMMGAVAAAGIEAAWWISGLVSGAKRHIFPHEDD